MGTSYKADNLLRGDDLIINNFFVLRFALLPSQRTSQYTLSATHTQKTPKPFDPSQECNTETCSIKACCVWGRALKALQSTPVYQGQPPRLVCTLDALIPLQGFSIPPPWPWMQIRDRVWVGLRRSNCNSEGRNGTRRAQWLPGKGRNKQQRGTKWGPWGCKWDGAGLEQGFS